MKIRIFGLLAMFALACITSKTLESQTLGGSITKTENITYMNGWPDLPTTITWSNWKYKDASGKTHAFLGKSTALYKYIRYKDGTQPKCTGVSYSNLTNVQATDGSIYYLTTANGGNGNINGYGFICPKYQVMSVVYAPPGVGAKIDYSTSTILGTSTNVSHSFQNGIKFSVEVGGSFFGLLEGTTTYTGAWTRERSSSNAATINKASSSSLIVDGQVSPAPAYGIDHDYDVIYICLNPLLMFSGSTDTSYGPPHWDIGCDSSDINAGTDPDVIHLSVAQLKALAGNQTQLYPSLGISSTVLTRLARTWAGSNQGLTASDYTNILGRDPFCNDGTNGTRPVIDTAKTNNRFQQVGSVSYQPLQPGQGGISEKSTISYEKISSSSTKAVDTYSVSSEDKADVNFWVVCGLNYTSTYTWTNATINTLSTDTTQSASYSIPCPPSTWTGKTEILVFQDVVYGTFFFSY